MEWFYIYLRRKKERKGTGAKKHFPHPIPLTRRHLWCGRLLFRALTCQGSHLPSGLTPARFFLEKKLSELVEFPGVLKHSPLTVV